jgi:engulfment/cell motility protein 1
MDEPPDVDSLVAGLQADSDSARKYAVFKLKTLLGDPSFADAFIRAEGLFALREAVLDSSGNLQAYALGSLNALLELDMAWECCDEGVLEKVGLIFLILWKRGTSEDRRNAGVVGESDMWW